jgi:hypothetical protein
VTTANNPTARLGAACYFIWGLLHVQAAYSVYKIGAALDPGMVKGRVDQDAWNLLFFAICALMISITGNWRNDSRGYWLNLAVISATDIGFILFVLVPGYIPLWPGILGPMFWILGWIFTTIALTRTDRTSGARP